jgi:uncharacterized metal-binding protein YceD (DUF177 family)
MKNLKAFSINFASLADGEHHFTFALDANFLENFEASLITDANATVEVTMFKQTGLLTFHFDLSGTIPAVCDVCGEDFWLSITAEETVLVKLVSVIPDDDFSEIVYIENGSSQINIAQMLYEMLLLCIPIRKVHPDTPEGEPTCNPDTLKLLKDISPNSEDKPKPKGPSIWDALKDLN